MYHSYDRSHTQVFTRPRHRPRTDRRMSPSVAPSLFSPKKATTFLALQTWLPMPPRRSLLPLPKRKRPLRHQRLQNLQRSHYRHHLVRGPKPSSRKATAYSRPLLPKRSLWSVVFRCQRSRVLVLMVESFAKISKSTNPNLFQLMSPRQHLLLTTWI